ncbi:hypothetical protein MANES_09G009600v8 [Manihot esculenta]|uniref:Uncharacterized protein n=1 Tax=Manihot esculenta TaxID=3983 RepID=A0A2C9V6L7_MANES|nr:hypothetical protein MANES_09G009600v8 [Manihot esculenta]
MAGLQYYFFPTDFYYPLPLSSTTTSSSSSKSAVVHMQTERQDGKKQHSNVQEKENSRSLP